MKRQRVSDLGGRMPGSDGHAPRIGFRGALLGLVLAVLLPTLGLAVLAINHVCEDARTAAETGLRQAANALAIAVDRDIAMRQAALQGLASSPVFGADPANPDLAALYAQAQRLARQFDMIINVMRPDGTHVLSTTRPLGTALPKINAIHLVARVVGTRAPAVGNLVVGSVTGNYTFSVGVPVMGPGGQVALVIAGSIKASQLQSMLAGEVLPAGQAMAVLDARHVLVASTSTPAEIYVGRAVPVDNQPQYESAEAGLFRAKGADGVWRVLAFHAIAVAPGWDVAVGLGQAAMDATWQVPLLTFSLGGAALVAIGLLLALLAARRILLPLHEFCAHARLVAAGDGRARQAAGAVPPMPVAELEDLRVALMASERAIRRRERELEALYAASPVGLIQTDPAGRVLECNEEFARMVGVARPQILSGNWRWNENTPPEWLPAGRQAAAESATSSDGRSTPFEKEFLRPDGSRVPVLVSLIVLDTEGQQRRGAAFVVDLTDIRRNQARLVESEARLRTLADAMPQLVWTARPDGENDYHNARFHTLLGAVPGTLTQAIIREAVHPDDRARVAACAHHAIVTGEDYESEYRLRRHDGVYRHVLARAVAMRAPPDAAHPDGRILQWFGATTDITDMVEAREMLAHGRDELERLVAGRTRELQDAQAALAHSARMEALGRLAGGIAHDFNNVLQAVGSASALIERRPNEPEAVTRLARLVMLAADRGASITNRLLVFSRRGELRRELVAIGPLLHGVRDILGTMLGAGIEVDIVMPAGVMSPSLPPVLCDKGQLETVLVNLATNARDAMDGVGTVILAVAVETLSEGALMEELGAGEKLKPGRYLRLSVADTGCGIAPDALPRVIEPFFTTKPQGQGTGLGLAMAHGFAAQCGGALQIESAPGTGTLVSLWFPAAGTTQEPPEPNGWAPPCAAGTLARVLVVDDDAFVREVLADQAEAGGYRVFTADSAATALALLDAGEAVDALVTDLSMPGMDGVALIAEVRRRRPGLPAILLTGYLGRAAETAMDGAASGAWALLRKPVDGRQLLERLSVLLEGMQVPG